MLTGHIYKGQEASKARLAVFADTSAPTIKADGYNARGRPLKQ